MLKYVLYHLDPHLSLLSLSPCVDITQLRPIKDQLPEHIEFWLIKMAVAILLVTTGFVRPAMAEAECLRQSVDASPSLAKTDAFSVPLLQKVIATHVCIYTCYLSVLPSLPPFYHFTFFFRPLQEAVVQEVKGNCHRPLRRVILKVCRTRRKKRFFNIHFVILNHIH